MNELMICKYQKCNKFLFDPILLQCSNNVCRTHIDVLITYGFKSFKCLACDSEHEIPANGFISNTIVANMIDTNAHLSGNAKLLAQKVNKIKEEIQKFGTVLEDPINFIFDYISSFRNEIDLERVRLIDEINTLSDAMINELNIYEKECESNIKRLNHLNEQHKLYLSMISNDIQTMKDNLRIPNLDKTKLGQIFQSSNQLIKDIERKFEEYKYGLLLSKKCYFNASNTQMDQNNFGRLIITNLNSSILSINESVDLVKLCEFNVKAEFKLLYQATRDGFSFKNFHEKCDNFPNTLTIIKVKDKENVFGGFASVSWDQSNQYKKDPKAFIFSLINIDKRPLKINVTDQDSAIFCSDTFGIIFGNGLDIYVTNNSNTTIGSYSNFGSSYKNNLYAFGSSEADNFLAGSWDFKTEEIEVFQLV